MLQVCIRLSGATDGDDANVDAFCRLHSPSSAGRDGWILKGVCAKPWLTNLNIFTETANERLMTPHEKMDLYTSVSPCRCPLSRALLSGHVC